MPASCSNLLAIPDVVITPTPLEACEIDAQSPHENYVTLPLTVLASKSFFEKYFLEKTRLREYGHNL